MISTIRHSGGKKVKTEEVKISVVAEIEREEYLEHRRTFSTSEYSV